MIVRKLIDVRKIQRFVFGLIITILSFYEEKDGEFVLIESKYLSRAAYPDQSQNERQSKIKDTVQSREMFKNKYS